MKHALAALFAVLLCLLLPALPCAAEPIRETDGGILYTVAPDGHAVVRGYRVTGYTLEIPAEIDGHPVTEIADAAFCSDPYLTDVTLPDSVTLIGAQAFESCSALRSVRLPDGMKILPRRLFAFCPMLRSVRLPSALEEIEEQAFDSCVRLGQTSIPAGLTRIADRAFIGCESLIFDCGENDYARGYAASHGIPTDRKDTSERVILRLLLVTASLGAVAAIGSVIWKKAVRKKGK